jgi:hypothetical protein
MKKVFGGLLLLTIFAVLFICTVGSTGSILEAAKAWMFALLLTGATVAAVTLLTDA